MPSNPPQDALKVYSAATCRAISTCSHAKRLLHRQSGLDGSSSRHGYETKRADAGSLGVPARSLVISALISGEAEYSRQPPERRRSKRACVWGSFDVFFLSQIWAHTVLTRGKAIFPPLLIVKNLDWSASCSPCTVGFRGSGKKRKERDWISSFRRVDDSPEEYWQPHFVPR